RSLCAMSNPTTSRRRDGRCWRSLRIWRQTKPNRSRCAGASRRRGNYRGCSSVPARVLGKLRCGAAGARKESAREPGTSLGPSIGFDDAIAHALGKVRRVARVANRGFRLPSARAKAEVLLKRTGDKQQMAKLQLSFACGLYDRMQPLYTGEVKAEGIDLNFIAIDQPRPIFDRMAGGEEFDVAEFSSSEFVQRFARKQCPFVAIPVFPSRAFRHGFIAVHRKAGISTPKDLEGKRVGVPLFTMTAAIYINGLLQHEYGVDLRKVHWVQ